MINILKRTIRDSSLREIDQFKVGSWVNVEDPSEEEIVRLEDELKVDGGHLRDALDIQEVPRLEFEDGTPYIFTRIPYQEKSLLFTYPLLIVIGDSFLLTVSKAKLSVFERFLGNTTNYSTTQKVKLFIQIFNEINRQFSSNLTSISRNIYRVSLGLEKVGNKDIQQLVTYEQALNDYLNALIRNSTILDTLLSGKRIQLFAEDRELVEDLFLASEQLVVLAKNSMQSVRNIRDAYSAILTNNLNRTIKFLTSLTIILTVPTMIASFFGMNVDLPVPGTEIGFWFIFGSALGISALLLFVFYRNDWL